MSAPRQLALPAGWAVAETLVDRFEARLRSVRQVGLTLWTGALRAALRRLFAAEQSRRAGVYEQLMLLEHELEAGADRARLLARIGAVKGLLAALMLTLCLWQLVADGDTPARAMRRGRARRRDEWALTEET